MVFVDIKEAFMEGGSWVFFNSIVKNVVLDDKKKYFEIFDTGGGIRGPRKVGGRGSSG